MRAGCVTCARLQTHTHSRTHPDRRAITLTLAAVVEREQKRSSAHALARERPPDGSGGDRLSLVSTVCVCVCGCVCGTVSSAFRHATADARAEGCDADGGAMT